MKSDGTPQEDRSVIRVELRYCPRCGALSIGVSDQPVCSMCVGVLRWLYTKAPRPRAIGKGEGV